ncbi:O-methyltransferase [Tenggerimyces flavus]|uniref:O-methyltransferase n=1 Tax=Tenggerimyces flavus TaxID=1708749 RepID=A0ABV7YRD7_9ACTN|nr:putative O-methyltransferase YrrM [Tenggerimyces flavus]
MSRTARWFAAALRRTGGQLVSVDVDEVIQAEARANLVRAGLDDIVELRTADGGVALRELADGSVDALFLDAERVQYASWWPDPVRVLRPGGLLIVDNVLSHPDEVVDISARIEADSSPRSTVVAVGKGELIAVKGG